MAANEELGPHLWVKVVDDIEGYSLGWELQMPRDHAIVAIALGYARPSNQLSRHTRELVGLMKVFIAELQATKRPRQRSGSVGARGGLG